LLSIVALALPPLARNVHVRQEVHLDFDDAVALARFATAALDVEAETSRLVAARARFRNGGEHFADRREQSRVGGRVRARRAADRALIDGDDARRRVPSFG